jgi:tetratricopeptide (TPR) repeat protein
MTRPVQTLLFASALAACLGSALMGTAFAQDPAPAADAAPPKKKRQPPPAVIPTEETLAAQKQYQSGRYNEAVTLAKAALNRNERYTPAMLIMAKAFYKLGKYEWVRTLWETMQKNNASPAEQAEVFNLLAFMEIEKDNIPGAIELLKKAVAARPENALTWNNLGGMYLTAKNFREAVPALERATQLQPTFAKAFLNLGSAYRGNKEYEKAKSAYDRALQLFSNYADAVFNLGILYLDADKMPKMDLVAQMNTAISYLQKYKQMMGPRLTKEDPAEPYIAEAQEKISKEEKRLDREKKRLEREAQRAAQKSAPGAKPAEGAPPAPEAPKP